MKEGSEDFIVNVIAFLVVVLLGIAGVGVISFVFWAMEKIVASWIW